MQYCGIGTVELDLVCVPIDGNGGSMTKAFGKSSMENFYLNI